MFYVKNLDVRQSRQANHSGSIVKRAKERFRNRKVACDVTDFAPKKVDDQKL